MAATSGSPQPLPVSILGQGPFLIASVHAALDDSMLVRFQRELVERIRRERSTGVIIDVAAMDVVDSFTCRTLHNLAKMAHLRGAHTVIVGITPELANTMVQLGTSLEAVHTALDHDERLALLDRLTGDYSVIGLARQRSRG